jgi:arsenate reductase
VPNSSNGASGGRHEAASAGTTPAERVHPEVAEVMREVALDLSGRVPRRLERAQAEWAELVVTMGCGDECPYVPGTRYIDWELTDPSGRSLEEVRAVREEIDRRVSTLVSRLDEAGSSPPHNRHHSFTDE